MVTTTLSKEEWAEVKTRLERPSLISGCKFQIDNHTVTVESFIVKRKVVLNVFVDGWQKGSWFVAKKEDKPDFVAKIYPTYEKYLYSHKVRNEFKQLLGARKWKTESKKYEVKFSYQEMHFKSVTAMKNTWEKNNNSITLIKD